MKDFYKVFLSIGVAVIPLLGYAGEKIDVKLHLINASKYRIEQLYAVRPGNAVEVFGDLFTACMTSTSQTHAEHIAGSTWFGIPPHFESNRMLITDDKLVELDLDESICFYISHDGTTPEQTFSAIYKVSDIVNYEYSQNEPYIIINYYGLDANKTSYSPELPGSNSTRFTFPLSKTPTYTIDVSFKGSKRITFYQPFMDNECYTRPFDGSPTTFGGDAGPYIDGKSGAYYTNVALFPRKNMEDNTDQSLSFCYRVEAGLYHQTYGPYKIQPTAENNVNVGVVEVHDTKHTCFITANGESFCDPFAPQYH